MYGMVNKAIQTLIINKYGENKYQEILKKAGVNVDVFLGMEQYPDEITYQLVGATSEILDISASEFLEKLGIFWVEYTSSGSYKDIFDMSGDDFVTFLLNLNDLHTRVSSILSELKPPSFKCTNIEKNSLHLHYYSDRAGLAPMVIGLVKGLGKKFNTGVKVEQISHKSQGEDHDEFVVNYGMKSN
jgi:hypothetical protein